VNIFPSPEQRFNPFQFYADMRHNNPVAYDERINAWGVFRYYDVQAILGDYTHFSSVIPTTIKQRSALSIPSLLRTDPPYHRKLRGVVASAFTPMAISKLGPRIERITHDLLNQVIEKGNMDLISDLAYPLPVTVIAELLGIPLQDRDTFRVWGDKFNKHAGKQHIMVEHQDADKDLVIIQSEMDDYFNGIIDKRTTSPQSDLISNLIKAEADGHHLSREEILNFCSILLIAGHVTTVNLIGNTILSLLQNPQEFKKLKDDRLSSSLISSTIEETLRYRSPVQFLGRRTTQEVPIGEQKIPSGQSIIVWLGSANHDELVFPDPEKFDISRKPHGHSHVGFGNGIHFCLGAPLARLEANIAIKLILERLQDLELDESKKEVIKPLEGLNLHGVSHIPLRFTAGNLVKTEEDQNNPI
jgi:cytochrome P450